MFNAFKENEGKKQLNGFNSNNEYSEITEKELSQYLLEIALEWDYVFNLLDKITL